MKTIKVAVNVAVNCALCGGDLEYQSSNDNPKGGTFEIKVSPCQECLKVAAGFQP